MTTYKGFNIETRKETRNQFGGWGNTQGSDNYEYGITEVKVYTITYKGFEREDEFKSLPSVKRFIDKGRLNMWVKMVDRWIKDGVEPINL